MRHKYLVRMGRPVSVALVTIISIVCSVALAYVSQRLSGKSDISISLMRAFVIPLIISPIASWYFIGLIIEVDQLREDMRIMADFDELTGLMNRRAFLSNAQYSMQIVSRLKQGMAFAYMDIDHFKKINDSFGHNSGDKALKKFAAVLNEHRRKSDLVGRIGGEEFAMVMTMADHDGALMLLEMMREAIRNVVIEHEGSEIRLTVSIGLAIMSPENEIDLDELIKRADMALYHAKLAGRDRVVSYGKLIGTASQLNSPERKDAVSLA